MLYTPFSARYRRDRLSETCTHADGVVGHYDFDTESRHAIRLTPSPGSQFVVYEAKIKSRLSVGTARIQYFDQAARTVACMAETLAQANQHVDQYGPLGFFVLAPRAQIERHVFTAEMTETSIISKISQRVAAYNDPTRQRWLDQWVHPLIAKMKLDCVSWESILDNIKSVNPEYEVTLRRYYNACKDYYRIEDHAAPPLANLAWRHQSDGQEICVHVVRRGRNNTRIRLSNGQTELVPNHQLRSRD